MKKPWGIKQPSPPTNGYGSSLYYLSILILVAGWAIAGCGSAKSEIISLDGSNAGQTVAATVGERIEITLQTIGPGQYGDPSVTSGSVKFLEEKPADLQNPGGPRQIYLFEAIGSGEAGITIPHTGGFPNGPETPSFAISITVK